MPHKHRRLSTISQSKGYFWNQDCISAKKSVFLASSAKNMLSIQTANSLSWICLDFLDKVQDVSQFRDMETCWTFILDNPCILRVFYPGTCSRILVFGPKWKTFFILAGCIQEHPGISSRTTKFCESKTPWIISKIERQLLSDAFRIHLLNPR